MARKSVKSSKKTDSTLTIEQVLGEAKEGLSAKQKILVRFLHTNYQKVAFASISALAKETKVSEATIVRLANQLGFDGYPSLQRAVRKIVSQQLTTLQRMQLSLDVRELDRPVEGLLKTDLRNIMRLYQQLSREEIEAIVAMVLEADSVVVSATMASAPLSLYFGYALTRVRHSVSWFTEDSVTLKQRIAEMGRNDLLIGFGFPRYPAAVVSLFTRASEMAIKRLAFTDTSASPLVPLADRCVFLPFETVGFVDSLAAPISFLAGLISEMAKSRPASTAERLRKFEMVTANFRLFHHD